MNEVEALLTDVVAAIAASMGAAFAELEPRVQGNFKSRIAADAIRALIQKVPADAPNRDTIIAVYENFSAALVGKLPEAPSVPLRQVRGPSAKKNTQQGRPKRNP